MTERLTDLTGLTDAEVRRLCEDFLYREAELLDNDDAPGWLEMLSPELSYRVPAQAHGEAGYSDRPLLAGGAYLEETYASLRVRVERLATGHAWSEQPRARTCRLVTNVRPGPRTRSSVGVRSNFFTYRTQPDGPGHDLLCGERRDLLVVDGGRLLLAERVVLLTPTVLNTLSLSLVL